MLLFVILSVIVIQVFSSDIPLFTPFDLVKDNVAYVIRGTYCSSFIPGTITCKNVTWLVDPPNKRMMFNLGTTGIQIVTETEAYIWGNPLFSDCKKVTGWNWSKQVSGFSKALSVGGSQESEARYFGKISTSASCSHPTSVMITVENDHIVSFNYFVDFANAIPPATVSTNCIVIPGDVQFEQYITNRNVINAEWKNPRADCTSTSADYCDFSYPSGNPCIISP